LKHVTEDSAEKNLVAPLSARRDACNLGKTDNNGCRQETIVSPMNAQSDLTGERRLDTSARRAALTCAPRPVAIAIGISMTLAACGFSPHLTSDDRIVDHEDPPATIEMADLPPPHPAMSPSRPMHGPSSDLLPLSRQGAAIVPMHPEPVLTFVASAPIDPPTPDVALSLQSAGSDTRSPANPAAQADLAGHLALALYRVCHGRPQSGDLTDLYSHRLIAPGQTSHDACSALR
jgi:hypothetical protein